jgi:uncharacterized protein YlzI (FlbEa/FlbD family)
MIELTRFGARREPLWLNPDLIVTIEANPDTMITLTNAAKVVVAEAVEDVVERIRAWRVEILARANTSRPLTPVR